MNVKNHDLLITILYFFQYSFYKNIACFTCQLLFAIYSNFSGQSLYDVFFLFLFNTIYTSLPPVVYGLFEQRYPDTELLKFPELYKNNHGNFLMTKSMFFLWVGLGVWHSLCSFFPWLFVWKGVIETAPKSGHSLCK